MVVISGWSVEENFLGRCLKWPQIFSSTDPNPKLPSFDRTHRAVSNGGAFGLGYVEEKICGHFSPKKINLAGVKKKFCTKLRQKFIAKKCLDCMFVLHVVVL